MPLPRHESGDSPVLATNSPSVFSEQLLRLSQAAALLPSVRNTGRTSPEEKPPHPSTLARWAKTGLKSRSGDTVRLEIWRVGGTNCTSLEALARFFDRLDDIKLMDPPQSPNRSAMELARQAEDAVKILRDRGLLDRPRREPHLPTEG